jgi:hypothetical protein
MQAKIVLTVLLSINLCLLSSQVPQGFNYQALALDGTGNAIKNYSTLQVKISILSDTITPVVVWEELHNPVKTDRFGVFNLVIGAGVRQSGSALTFSDIDWTKAPLYIKTQIYYPNSWKYMGSAKLWSVPYSMVAGNLEGSVPLLSIKGNTSTMDSALFVVRNHTGQIVFAVYNEGVRIYVDDGKTKGATKGGFAIGSFDKSKGTSQPLFVVDPDSIRAYLDNNPVKSVKGGFAIGGFDRSKGANQNFLSVSKDSIRMYIDDNLTSKSTKGGFAIGSFDKSKGGNINFLNVSTDSSGIINPSQNRILWYPLKNAFLTGRVLIQDKDSVGENSFASGYESRSKGKYSQALGYKAIARGDYSTAIGKDAVADKINSFAFGDSTFAVNSESYAFGRGAVASGYRSFSFGSAGIDYEGAKTDITQAIGDYSFAIGQGSRAEKAGSFALGIRSFACGDYSIAMGQNCLTLGKYSIAMGVGSITQSEPWPYVGSPDFSVAIGYNVKAAGWASTALGFNTESFGMNSTAMGDNTLAEGNESTAMGYHCKSIGSSSTAMGDGSLARGWYSTAMGSSTIAASAYETAIGLLNTDYTPASTTDWVATDRLFVIGKGSITGARSNAMTVLKNGNVGIGVDIPKAKLHIYGGLLIENPGAPPILSGEMFFLGWNGAGLGLGETDFYQHGEAGLGGYDFYSQRNTRGMLLLARLKDNGDLLLKGSVGSLSDERRKTNIRPLNDGLKKILKLQGVCFNWKDTIACDNNTHLGLIAQNVLKVLPEVVKGGFQSKGEEELYSIQYDGIIPVLIEAIKEQQQQIESYKTQVKSLQEKVGQIESQQKEIDELKTLVNTLITNQTGQGNK